MPIVIDILLAIHVLVSLLIVLLVLMQRPKSEGLGAAFGGGMTDNLFGAQSSNVLQTITRWLGCIFFALSLGLSLLYVKVQPKTSIQKRLPTAAAAAPTPATPAVTDEDKVREAVQKILEQQKHEPAPADAKPETPAPAPTQPVAPEKTPETPEK